MINSTKASVLPDVPSLKVQKVGWASGPPRPTGFTLHKINKSWRASGGIFLIPPSLTIRIYNPLNNSKMNIYICTGYVSD